MKPEFEFRAKAKPKKARKKCAFGDPACPCQDGDVCHYVAQGKSPAMEPPPRIGGRWVWVRDDQICEMRDRKKINTRMRDYMRRYRAKPAK